MLKWLKAAGVAAALLAFFAIGFLGDPRDAHAIGVVVQSGPRYFTSGGGSLVDGASYNWTSTVSLGAPPTAEFLGGKNGVIDSGTVGAHFTRANWNQLFTTISDWKWSTTQTRNRSRAFRYDGLAQGETGAARGTYQYDTGASGYTNLYYSANIRWQANASFSGIQWKMFRHQTGTDHTGSTDNGFGGPEVVDGNPPSTYWSNAITRDTFTFTQFTSVNPSYVFGDAFNTVVYWTADDGGTLAAPQNGWYRMEHTFRENSNTSTSDGVGTIKFTATNGSQYLSFSTTNRLYRGPNDFSRASRPFRYFILQNYFGNAPTNNGNDFGDSILDFDDIYISTSWHHVDISDGVSEPNIQKITAASGTARTIELNLGHLDCVTNHCTLREYDSTNTLVTTLVISQNLPPPANDEYFSKRFAA